MLRLTRRVGLLPLIIGVALSYWSIASAADQPAPSSTTSGSPSGVTITTSAPSMLGATTTVPPTSSTLPNDGSSPRLTLTQADLAVGSQLQFAVAGFKTRLVNVAVCGNAARRGSSDCDVKGSQTVTLNPDGATTAAIMTVGNPPMPCPCLIRVSSGKNDELAVASVTLADHPLAPVVGSVPFADRMAAKVSATEANSGLTHKIRSSLGGATEYSVTLMVKNPSSEAVQVTTIEAWAGHDPGSIRTKVVVPVPASIEPGQTWQQVVTATLPSPVRGETTWHMDVVAKGEPLLSATTTTTHRPMLLLVLIAVLVADLVVLAVRFFRRRLRRTRAGTPSEVVDPDPVRTVEYSS